MPSITACAISALIISIIVSSIVGLCWFGYRNVRIKSPLFFWLFFLVAYGFSVFVMWLALVTILSSYVPIFWTSVLINFAIVYGVMRNTTWRDKRKQARRKARA